VAAKKYEVKMVHNYLSKFEINLTLGGINSALDANALQELSYELSMRPHILKHQISWANIEHTETKNYVETGGLEPNPTGRNMAEEILEIASAVLNSIEGIHVNVISVNSING
jgi:hypothetical protein